MNNISSPLQEDISTPLLYCADKVLNLSTIKVMGILNLTPDSFYEGGKFHLKELALKRVATMIEEGADIIDIGGESTRPYAETVSTSEEIDRIMEILIAIRSRFDTIISVDTYKTAVMKEAIAQGIHFINDINALQSEGAIETVAQSGVGICLMHKQGVSQTMQDNPFYHDVVGEVGYFLQQRINLCLKAGIDKNRMVIDPGFGFGKTTEHNMRLLNQLGSFRELGRPLLVGLSRKSSLGEILSAPVEDRLYGSIAAHTVAAINGASIIRTHDIKPTVDAIRVAEAILLTS